MGYGIQIYNYDATRVVFDSSIATTQVLGTATTDDGPITHPLISQGHTWVYVLSYGVDRTLDKQGYLLPYFSVSGNTLSWTWDTEQWSERTQMTLQTVITFLYGVY